MAMAKRFADNSNWTQLGTEGDVWEPDRLFEAWLGNDFPSSIASEALQEIGVNPANTEALSTTNKVSINI